MTTDELTRYRAIFVYETACFHAELVDAPIVPEYWGDRDDDFKTQFLETIKKQCSDERFTSPEAAHDSWVKDYEEMGWKYGPVRDPVARTHPDMVPFDQLEQREQDKDEVFLLLCDIARRFIR